MPGKILPSFNTGEISPRLHSRVDLDKYGSACQVLENFIIMPYGGVNRRPGTQFMGGVKDHARKVRLIGFNFSVTTNFVLEFGHQYVRFWSNGAQVERGIGAAWVTATAYAKDAKVLQSGAVYRCLTAHTSGTFSTDLAAAKWELETAAWVTSHAYARGEYVMQSGTMYFCATAHTSGDFLTNLGEGKWVEQTILELVSPYQEEDLQEFQFVQINDVMYMAHNDYPVQKLSRLADDRWTFAKVVWDHHAYREENVDTITVKAAEATGNGIGILASEPIFQPEDVGSFFRIGHSRESAIEKMELISDDTSSDNGIRVLGQWDFVTTGDWDGKVYVERRTTTSGEWMTVRSFVSDSNKRNVSVSGYEEQEVYLRIRFDQTASSSGRAYLEVVESITYGEVEVTDIPPASASVAISNVTNSTGEFLVTTSTDHLLADGQLVEISGVLGSIGINGRWVMKRESNTTFKCTGSTFGGSYTSSTGSVASVANSVATVNITKPLWTNNARTQFFSENAWNPRRGYPRSVALHEGRLFFAGTKAQPQTVWGSFVDDFENFRVSTDDDAGLSFTISSSEQNTINWMLSHQVLVLGTNGEEWIMDSAAQGGIITPTSIRVKRQSRYGSKYAPALLVNEVPLFIQRQGKKIREFVYSFEKDGYLSPDLTLLAEHVTDGGIVQVAFQQQPDAILWCVTGKGILAGMTYERDQNVVGWHRHITDGEIESVATIYGDDTADEVWVAVKRTVDGETRRYVERLDPYYRQTLSAGLQEDWFYVDCGVTVEDETPFTVVEGLEHLEGKTVSILADGAVHPDLVVENGQVTLDYPVLKVQAGLLYTSKLQPMPLDLQLGDGTAQGRKFRINRLLVRFYKSLGSEIEVEPGIWDAIEFRMLSDAMNETPEPFTGEKEITIATPHTNRADIALRQQQPLPMTVLALIPKFDVQGD